MHGAWACMHTRTCGPVRMQLDVQTKHEPRWELDLLHDVVEMGHANTNTQCELEATRNDLPTKKRKRNNGCGTLGPNLNCLVWALALALLENNQVVHGLLHPRLALNRANLISSNTIHGNNQNGRRSHMPDCGCFRAGRQVPNPGGLGVARLVPGRFLAR